MIFKGYAQPSSAAPTPPTRNSSDVVSLFSDAYTNVSGADFFPNWGQSTVVSNVTVAGDATKYYSNLNYQGLQLSSSLDVSSMQTLHMDIWTSDVSSLNVFLINTSPSTVQQSVTVTPTTGSWYAVDINLSSYDNIALNNIGQMMFTGSGSFYMDNLYFYKAANVPSLSNFTVPSGKIYGDAAFTIAAPTSNSTGTFSYSSSNTSVATINSSRQITITGVGTTTITATQAAAGAYGSGTISATFVVGSPNPTSSPATPTKTASNVISLFSNAYTNVSIDTWLTGWSGCSSSTDVTVGSNTIKKYVGLNYAGIEATGANAINASSMENVHIDAWSMDATSFKLKLVDWGANNSYGGGDDVEHEVVYTFTPATSASGSWTSYDIPMSDFVNLTTRGHISQIILSSSGSTMFFDNFYFWRNNPAPTIGTFTVPAKTVGAANFSLIAPSSNSSGSWSYTSSDANVATISGSTVTVVGAGTAVITATQAATSTYAIGTATANLVVTGPDAPTSGAPTPPARVATDVISLFSDSYSNVSGTDWFPWWWQNAVAEDTTIAGNLAHKYPNLNYHGVQFGSGINASGMTSLHFDIWTKDCETFDFYLINTYNGTEKKISVTPPYRGWQSYDIALSQFSSQGIDLTNIGQFKFVSTPFGGTTVYMDNIYFWKPAGSPVYGTFAIPTKTVGDAKFKITAPSSTSTGAFTYTSSNTSVATVSNDSITVVGGGVTTITATQAAAGGYLTGTISATLTVNFPAPLNAAPTPPSRNTADVISVYSNAYTSLSGTNFSPYWGQSTAQSDVLIAGNNNLHYQTLNYIGVQLASPVNVSAMQYLHVDVWTSNCTSFEVSLVTEGCCENAYAVTPIASGWKSIDIPLTSYTSPNLSNIGQLKFVGSPFGTSDVYVDNVYFWKGTAKSPSISIVQPTCAVATGSISVVSSTTGLTFSKDNGVTYSTASSWSGLAVGTYKIRSKTSGGIVSDSVVATILSTSPTTNPGTITGVRNINQCDTLQNYSVPYTPGLLYTWATTGTGNYIKSGNGSNAVVAVMKVAGTVTVKSRVCSTSTTYSPVSTVTITKAVPTAPATKSSTGLNVCQYTASAVAITGVKDTFRIRTVANATGYYFQVPGGSTMQRLNDTTITVVFPDTITATPAKSVKAYSLSSCDTSLALSFALTRTVVTAPSIWASSLTNVAGVSSYTYKIRKATNALSYTWVMKIGTAASITHLNASGPNDTAVTVTYATGFTKDTVAVSSVSGCGSSVQLKLPVSALAVPPTPASVTGNNLPCIGSTTYTYTAVAGTPTTAQAPTARFRWTLPANSQVMTSNSDSSVIGVKFNTGYVGGMFTVKAVSAVGVLSAASKNDTLKYATPTPGAVTSSTASFNHCIGSTATYTVAAGVLTATSAPAVVYRWTKPTTVQFLSANSDSSQVTLKFNTGFVASSVTIKGQTACGVQSATAKTQAMTHTGCAVGTRLATSTTTTAEVYPNPNNGNFNININTGIENNMSATISIIDMYGKVVAQYNAVNNFGRISKSISTGLTNGIYTVKYNVGSVTNSVRMIVQK